MEANDQQLEEMINNNKKLEKIVKKNPKDVTEEDDKNFVKLFKESQVIMPVEFNPENRKESMRLNEPPSFKPRFISKKGNDNESIIPLFTNPNEMADLKEKVSTVIIYTEDLFNMLKNAEDISGIVINPFNEPYMEFPFTTFLEMFLKKEEIAEAGIDVFNKAIPLEENTVIFYREKEPTMKQMAENGIYCSELALAANIDGNDNMEYPYLNILLLPKSTKIIYSKELGEETKRDIFLAPRTEFEFIDQEDEYTFKWVCTKQHFYND